MKSTFRHALSCLLAVLPSALSWGQELRQDSTHVVHWGAGLHSSTNPTAWMDGVERSDDTIRREGQTLKEPVISSALSNAQRDAQPHTRPEGTEEVGVFYEEGIASYYSAKTHGRMMASGERYDKNGLFCAHKTLPFGTRIRVVNKKNGKAVVVVVKDRGPFGKGRVVDLSNRAAAELGMLSAGIVPCELWVLEEK